jgi:predicted Zn-dependent peptidase
MRLCCLFVLSAITASAQVKLPPFTKQTLPNGITVVLMPRTELPLVSINVIARGGAEADPPDQAGLAALTAELMRSGAKSRDQEWNADQIALALDSIGATLNAQADEQAITLRAEFLARDTAKALGILAGVTGAPTFPEDEVKKVLGRALDNARAVKDNPQAAIQGYYRAFLYGAAHPYRRTNSGDELSIPRISREAIVKQHQRLFAGKNLIIVATGSFAPQELGAALTQAFSGIPAGAAIPSAADPGLPRPTAARVLIVDKPDATQTYFLIGQPGLKRGHPDQTAVQLVNTLFGGRFTSMLNDELRVNSGLTYGANSQVSLNRLTGAITISSFTKTETTERAIDLALSLLKKLNEQGITQDQLDSAKTYTKGLYPVDRLETTDQLAQILGEIELFGLNRGEVDDSFSRIDAVTRERANAMAKQYYQPGALTFVLLGNAAKIRETARKWSPNVTEVKITAPGFPVK